MSFGGGGFFFPTGSLAPPATTWEDIPRWLMASCRTFFDARRGEWPMYFMGLGNKDLTTDPSRPTTAYTEFRMDGPFIQKMTAKETKFNIEINVLCVSGTDQSYSDEIEKILGRIAASFEVTIPIYRFGDQRNDDQSYVGCMILLQEKNESIIVSRFGQANADTFALQASVEGHYEMRLTY